MSRYYCSFGICNSSAIPGRPGYDPRTRFFSFPQPCLELRDHVLEWDRNDERRHIPKCSKCSLCCDWMVRCRRKDEKFSSIRRMTHNYRICSKHFPQIEGKIDHHVHRPSSNPPKMDSLLGLFDPSEDNSLDGDNLPPEPQLGNIEYKLKLLNPSRTRFQHLVTQLKWRLREGGGEAIYEIGVEDSGLLAGLPSYEMDASLKTLSLMAAELGATTTILREREIGCARKVTEVLVRKVPADQHTIEVRVAVMGSADAGKSTLVGVLTEGQLDNGRGRARLNTFRHLHEVRSGRTSSISHATLGFDPKGKILSCYDLECGEDLLCTKLISLLDLAGHRKYLRTTVQAVSGYRPHQAMLVVSSQSGVVGMTREHVAISSALDVPMFIVITKTDLGSSQSTVDQLTSLLTSPGVRKVPMVIKTEDDVMTVSSGQVREGVVPIFQVSSVTGEGLDFLAKYLHVLPPGSGTREKERLDQELPEFQIDEIFRVADVGTVVGGLLTKGVITERTDMLVGPDDNGVFTPVRIQSVHRNKTPCRAVHSTQSASLALEPPLATLRAGMVLISPHEEPTASFFFQATVRVLYHATGIHPGFQTTVHIGNIRQTAVIEGIMSQTTLHTNDRASVLFRFVRHPEYVRPGARLLFREGPTKGIGTVTQVFPVTPRVTAPSGESTKHDRIAIAATANSNNTSGDAEPME